MHVQNASRIALPGRLCFLPSCLTAPVQEDNTKFSAYNAPPTPPPLEESPPAPPAMQVVPDAGKQTQPKHKPPRKAEKKGKEDSLPSAAEVLRNVSALDMQSEVAVVACS